MAEMFTPKRNSIDTSLQNTPMPQATSTIEKSKFPSSKVYNILKYNDIDKIPSLDGSRLSSVSSSSRQSSANSSLGILQVEQLEDIGHNIMEDNLKNDPFKKPLPKLSINAELDAQRQLALRTLERSSINSKHLPKTILSRHHETTIDVPSYLLQANSLQSSVNHNESTERGVTIQSDITGSLVASSSDSYSPNDFTNHTEQISFVENDFSARSSIAKSEASESKKITSQEMKKKLEMLTESFMKSQSVLNDEDYEDIISNSYETDSSFTPAEFAQDKINKYDLSWMRERGLPEPTATIDISRISAEFSEFARQQREKSIGEFFSEKCPRISDMHFLDNNCVRLPSSPVNLVDSFESTTVSEKPSLPVSVSNTSVKSEATVASSVLSLTSIARTLEEMTNDSPNKIINRMLKKCKQVDNATYTKKEQPKTTMTTSDKENNESTLSKSSQIVHNNSTQVLKDSSNITTHKLNKFHSSTKTDLPSCVTPQLDNYNPATEYSPKSGVGSISRTLSELNLSDMSDEASSSISKDFDMNSWLIVKSDPIKICTQILTQAKLEFLSKCNRWILVEVKFKEIQLKNGPAIETSEGILSYNIPGSTILVEPDRKVNFDFEITTLIPADINFIMHLTLIDMVTRESCNMQYALHITSISPKISLNIDDDGVDFDLIGEQSHKEICVQIRNDSDVDTPIILLIEQQFIVFFLTNLNDNDYKWNLNLSLNPREIREFKMVMIGPEMKNIDETNRMLREFKGKFLVNIGTRNSYRLLKEVELFGRVGAMNLELSINDDNLPVKVYSLSSQELSVKNVGIVTMQLSVSLLNETFQECHENIFHIQPMKFTLMPGKRENLSISFSRKPFAVSRIMLIKEKYGRSFKYPIQGCNSTPEKLKMNRSKSPLSWCFQSQTQSPPSRLQSRSSVNSDDSGQGNSNRSTSVASSVSSTKPNSNYKDDKLPLDANKIEMIWGCTKVGKSVSSEIVIRNRSTNRLKFVANVNGSAFKFQNNSESSTNMNLVLQGNESRCLTIVFLPSRVGGAKGSINFTTTIGNYCKSVRLFGYGGHSKIDLMGVSKDTSDRIWFMLGYYDTQNGIMESSFLVRNTGVLPGFIYLKSTFHSLLSVDEPDLNISPKNLVIQPGETRKIYISYDPKKNFKKLFDNKDVCQVGTINIHTGPEPTRFRIRNLLNKLKLNAVISDQFKNLEECLNIEYEDEQMPADIALCRKESTNGIKYLFTDVETRVLNVVAEKNMEQSQLMADVDETCVYQSLCVDQSTIMENTLMPSSSIQNPRRVSHNKCHIEPEILNFVKPTKMHNKFVIVSQHTRPMQYQIVCKPHDLLQICPMEGIISPNGSSTINVLLATDKAQMIMGTILVYVENEVLSITVKANAENQSSYYGR